MPISINYSQSGDICLDYLNKNIKSQNNSIERLITGNRINSAKDDAAGVSIATNLNVKIRSLHQAMQNVQMGISYIELASETINGMLENVKELRNLAQRASSEIIGDVERGYIQIESDEIISSILNIKKSADFNGIKIFDKDENGIPTNINLQIGITVDSTSILNIKSGFDFKNTNLNFSSFDTSRESLDVIDEMHTTLDNQNSQLSVYANNLESALEVIISQSISLTDAKSLISDSDIAFESANYVKTKILTSFGANILNMSNFSKSDTFGLINNSVSLSGNNISSSSKKSLRGVSDLSTGFQFVESQGILPEIENN